MQVTKKSSKLTACLVGLLLGSIGVLAYSPFDYWIISFLSAGGLVWLATQSERGNVLFGTLCWGIGYFAIGVNWVQVSMIQFGGVPEIVSYLIVLLLAIYLTLYPILFVYLVWRFQVKNPWVLASIFTFTEYLRGIIFTGFPWLQFGYSLIDSPFSALATIFGVEGLTFFVMLTSGYFLQIFCNWHKGFNQTVNQLAIVFGVLLVAFSSQFIQWTRVDHSVKPVQVSLVQGNIPQQMKWDPIYLNHTLHTYEQMIRSVLGKTDIVILPESAIPALEEQIEPVLKQLDQLALAKNTEVIIGTLHQNRGELFNSAIVLGNPHYPYASETVQRFNKHHLVPFGEYVPFGHWLDWLREVFILPINLSQGAFIQSPLVVKQHRFNTAICYEVIFTDQVQKNQQANNADYLLTISNDAWFGESLGPWQHLQMARMRALELGKPMIRATNTGITAFIDERGTIISQAPQFQQTILTAQLPTVIGQTLFAKWGNNLLYGFCIMILVVGIIVNVLRKSRIKV